MRNTLHCATLCIAQHFALRNTLHCATHFIAQHFSLRNTFHCATHFIWLLWFCCCNGSGECFQEKYKRIKIDAKCCKYSLIRYSVESLPGVEDQNSLLSLLDLPLSFQYIQKTDNCTTIINFLRHCSLNINHSSPVCQQIVILKDWVYLLFPILANCLLSLPGICWRSCHQPCLKPILQPTISGLLLVPSTQRAKKDGGHACLILKQECL